MKKVFLLFVIIFCFQFGLAQKITFGVKGGANLASFTENFDSPFDYKYKLGFQLGGFARIELVDRLFLQPELLYSLQGTKYEISLVSIILPQIPRGADEFFNNGGTVSQNESNIILPVMLKYYLADKFNVEFGPQVDYHFQTKSDQIVLANEGIINNTDDTTNESDFNFGVNLGLGYDFNENMGLGVRYNYGFNRLFKNNLANYDNGDKRRNSIFSLSLEYRFN